MSADNALALFLNTLAISLPTFGWVVLGQLLNRLGLLPESLNNRISLLAFRYGLPLMLFAGAAQVDYGELGNARYVGAGVLATLATLALSWLYSSRRGHPRARQGIFVQAAYRSNLAIIGLALAVAAYGERATGLAALPVALLTVMYNVLAVWVLGVTHGTATRLSAMLIDILRNPLIIGIGAGIALSVSPLPVPAAMQPAGSMLTAFFLPVVLICIGGAMNLSRLYRADRFTWEACGWRLLVAPLLGLLIALALGVRDEPLGVLFLLLATPVAASSHVMVVAARGDGTLAANIVVLSTLLSVATITLGFFALSLFSLVGELR
ncbi:MAG: AEC family transporter [Halioglobus sp.]|nr:AEC family transporter [Halioglobus sp.]